MAIVEHKVPSPGESITEVVIARWAVAEGDYVEKDDVIGEIDSDKATLTINAEEAGSVKLMAKEGDTVKVGQVVCSVDTSAKAPEGKPKVEKKVEVKEEKKENKPNPLPVAETVKSHASGHGSPAAQKLMAEKGIKSAQLSGSGKGGRITLQDVNAALTNGFSINGNGSAFNGGRDQERKKMTNLRKKIAERLVSVKNETAMLTTFNEVDMKPVMELRKKYKDKFGEVHGIGLGFMSFFTKACAVALQQYPAVNAFIDGDEMVFNNYNDIGIAVSTPKG
jgi:2-oxoglutarate dehydrogenase E2 component (dihydrolipoamide succinyltransferase)